MVCRVRDGDAHDRLELSEHLLHAGFDRVDDRVQGTEAEVVEETTGAAQGTGAVEVDQITEHEVGDRGVDGGVAVVERDQRLASDAAR